MELNHLRYFYEVARQGSFTRASKALRVSQPSISKIVRLLEQREGVTLFERGKNGVTLTRAGRACFESCRRVFGEVEALRASLKAERSECSGPLGVGASDNVCNYLLPPLVTDFWKAHPEVSVHLFSGTAESIADELLGGRVELGFFYTALKDPRLELSEAGRAEFAVVCSSRNRLLARKRFDPRRLEKAFYIGSRVSDYAGPYPALQLLRKLSVRPKLFLETNSQETQKRIVEHELGYTVLPRFMVEKELREEVLFEIPAPKPIGLPLLLAKRRGHGLSRPAAEFKAFFLKRVGEALRR